MIKIDRESLLEKVKASKWQNKDAVEKLIEEIEPQPELWHYPAIDAARIFMANLDDKNYAHEFIQYIDVYLRHHTS